MKVLMLSGDPGVLDPNTETGNRTEEYRQILGTLDVLLCHRSIFNFIFGFFRGLWMMRKGYDIITAQDVDHSFLAWIFSNVFGTPWQMQIHTDIFGPHFVKSSILNRVRVWLAKFLLPRADCVRVVSERIRKSVEEVTYPLTPSLTLREGEVNSDSPLKVRGDRGVMNLVVLPIFIYTKKIRNAPIKVDLHKKYPGRFTILMASRLAKEKNIKLALQAIHELTRNKTRINANPFLLIVGDGQELNNLKLQVASYKLQDYVKFEPHTPDLISYYKTCDLFLLTSNYEGYGRTLIEAAAAGAKIVSSDVGIAPEILDRDCILKVGDKEDLKSKLTAALQGSLPDPKSIIHQTKEEYLRLYKKSFEICGGRKL